LLVRFDADTGLRAGELAALRVGRLDLLRGACEVVESATEVANELVWGATKTYERRTVRPHAPDDLVFTMPQGGPLREPKFAGRDLKPAARAAGLPAALRVHDLRHTCASLLIREGASIKAVQHHLGHRSASITVDRYGHLFPEELDHLADRLDRLHAEASVYRRPGGGLRARQRAWSVTRPCWWRWGDSNSGSRDSATSTRGLV
jgi:integrase